MQKVFRLLVQALILGTTSTYSEPQSANPTKTAVIFGYVTDPTMTVIPKATIILEASLGLTLQTTTDDDGNFSMEATPGYYTFKVNSPGFSAHEESIHLSDETTLKKKIVLQIASSRMDLPCTLCNVGNPQIKLLNASLTSTLPLTPLPPLKLHKRIAR